MAGTLSLYQRWGTTKPPVGVLVDPSHPLAAGLRQLWLCQAGAGRVQNTVRPGAVGAFNSANTAWALSPHGVCVALTTSTGYVQFPTDTALGLPTGPATVLLGYRKRDGTARATAAFGVAHDANDDNYMGCHLPYSDGTVYWDYGGSPGKTAGSTRLSVGSLTFGDDFWAFTTGPRGMEIWQNGVRRASNAGTPTRVNRATAFYWGQHDNTTACDSADIWYGAIYDRQLSPAAIQSLSKDPYQILAPPVWRRYVVLGDTPQTAVPISDISAGSWTASTGTDLYAMLDETPASDSDYDQSTTTPSSDVMEVRVTGLTDPASSTGHVVRYRARKPS